ncbi:MAG: DUF1186 domain-containing protein [Cyanobacteria bacterium P01_C01_bin.38]
MQLEEIISKLENKNGELPREALERAIEEREAITPLLLDILSNSKNNIKELSNKPDYILHICAFYLLAQFKEVQAYPLIIDFFSIPGDMPVNTTENLVGEGLGRILASVCDGNIEPIKQLIENTEIDRSVRAAGIESLMILVVQKIIPREEIIQHHKELFLKIYADKSSVFKDKKEQNYILGSLIMNSSMLAPVELQQYIEKTFDEHLIRHIDYDRQEFEYLLEIGPEATLNEVRNDMYYCLIEDAISDIESTCFVTFPFLQAQGFSNSPKKSKRKVKKNKKMQQESRRKNRSKKK